MNQQIKINNIDRLNITNSNIVAYSPIVTSNITVYGTFDSNIILNSFSTENFSNISGKISIKSFSYSNLADGGPYAGILQYVPLSVEDPSNPSLIDKGEWRVVEDDVTTKTDFFQELTAEAGATATSATFLLSIDNIFKNSSNGFIGYVCMSLKDSVNVENSMKFCFATVFKNFIGGSDPIQPTIIASNNNTEWVFSEEDGKLRIVVTTAAIVTNLYVNIR